ncbi:hypothetical protein FA13DRAFT_1794101 [Coprinellus micaceus]|uniref:Shugoshin N-terminal coiled-coil domain-containing protein n=1 Tax=Coprinellus micaceus TaxID=71717 RepID=A0A4Y7T2Y9_COPMI|nr:hypothetical protein FA13DRAFT_1794101 [Coprinellus micaceus]
MSKRESRVSTGARQTDALYEFEAFKKKFLLANKHITKLNSTLSVRVEELQHEIQQLQLENLRLRTSEVQLASELKREREKSRRIMQDAETAAATLQKHLGCLRSSLEIPRGGPSTPPAAPSPRAKHRPPPPDPDTEPPSPVAPRIARAPTIPGIDEEEEPEEEQVRALSPPKRKSSKSRPRLSASNLPLATNRISTPPPVEPNNVNDDLVHMDLTAAHSRRKPTRRQSGLLNVRSQGRPASPAFGSPVRLQAGRAEFQEEIAALNGEIEVEDDDDDDEGGGYLDKKSAKRRSEKRAKGETPMPASKERKRRREEEEGVVAVEAVMAKLKGRAALQPIDNTIHDQYDDLVSNGKKYLAAPTRSLSPSPVLSANSETDSQPEGGRQRRPDDVPELRKKRTSVATAGAKADSETGPSSKPISSSSSRARSPSPLPPLEDEANVVTTMRRRKSKPQMYHVEDEDEEASDGERDEDWAPSGSSKKLWGNVNVEGRKRMPGRRAGGVEEGRRHSLAV